MEQLHLDAFASSRRKFAFKLSATEKGGDGTVEVHGRGHDGVSEVTGRDAGPRLSGGLDKQSGKRTLASEELKWT